MSNVIKFGGEEKPSGDVLIRREQLAAQVVAVMQSHFSRPSSEEMKEILRCAQWQITAIEWRRRPE